MKNDEDIFDRIMSLPILNRFYDSYKRKKSVLCYLFFGALTTLISVFVFVIFESVLSINELLANIISWFFAVLFSYVTNKIWVFSSDAKGKNLLKEMVLFFGARITTLMIEEIILLIFVTLINFDAAFIKILGQIVVLILNYYISKLMVFKK